MKTQNKKETKRDKLLHLQANENIPKSYIIVNCSFYEDGVKERSLATLQCTREREFTSTRPTGRPPPANSYQLNFSTTFFIYIFSRAGRGEGGCFYL